MTYDKRGQHPNSLANLKPGREPGVPGVRIQHFVPAELARAVKERGGGKWLAEAIREKLEREKKT